MLIVLEGLDGAGKSTQLKMVTEYLSNQGKKVEYLHFPRYSSPIYGPLISKFLRGDFGSVEQVHPQLVALLFAEDRREAGSIIRSWVNQGHFIVLDRYVYSNIAFQCAKLTDKIESDELRDWILQLEYEIYNIPKPDLNLFLDVPLNFVDSKLKIERCGERNYLEGKSDIHESDMGLQKKVKELYSEQCTIDKDFKRIDCSDLQGNMLPASAIFEKIKKEVDCLL